MRAEVQFKGSSFRKTTSKSLFRKILRATTLESIFCRHKCAPRSHNSNESKILQKAIEQLRMATRYDLQTQTNDLQGQAWTYSQKTGDLEQDGTHVATGYSGAGEGKNNPTLQNVHNVGPIPQGDWTITGPPVNTEDHGPFVLRLNPVSGTETFSRSGFLMHGDSKQTPEYFADREIRSSHETYAIRSG